MNLSLEHLEPIPQSLDELFALDDMGLLSDVSPARAYPGQQGADPVVDNFLEVVDFVQHNGREPDRSNLQERGLAKRLQRYRTDPELRARVLASDTLGLLADPKEAQKDSREDSREDPLGSGAAQEEAAASKAPPASLDDLFADDTLGLLETTGYDIFNLEHVPDTGPDEREIPDLIARQRPCEHFSQYKELFARLHAVLGTNAVLKRKLKSEPMVKVGQFYLLRGHVCYIASQIQEGDYKGRDNPRLLVVFDNGTEIDILKLSFIRAMYKDEQSRFLDLSPNLLTDTKVQIQSASPPAGSIYILETLSTAQELAALKFGHRLVKIGFTQTTVQERIRNAEKDRTYLCAPVRLAYTLECRDMNVRTFEQLIHACLDDQRLNITLVDADGNRYQPKEWFTVSAETALQVAQRIVDGTISQYRMDNTTGKLVAR